MWIFFQPSMSIYAPPLTNSSFRIPHLLTSSQCASGKCENGACTKTACIDKTCETFEPCRPGNGCVCGTITDSASSFCVYGPTPCDGLKDCTSNTQCDAGEVCIESSCCERSVCVGPGGCGGSQGNQKRWFNGIEDVDALMRRGWVNATISEMSHWALQLDRNFVPRFCQYEC
jgi:hypothetical protein